MRTPCTAEPWPRRTARRRGPRRRRAAARGGRRLSRRSPTAPSRRAPRRSAASVSDSASDSVPSTTPVPNTSRTSRESRSSILSSGPRIGASTNSSAIARTARPTCSGQRWRSRRRPPGPPAANGRRSRSAWAAFASRQCRRARNMTAACAIWVARGSMSMPQSDRTIAGRRLRRLDAGVLPRRLQHVVRAEQEVARAARRIEHAHLVEIDLDARSARDLDEQRQLVGQRRERRRPGARRDRSGRGTPRRSSG